jgi:hypothetical protein
MNKIISGRKGYVGLPIALGLVVALVLALLVGGLVSAQPPAQLAAGTSIFGTLTAVSTTSGTVTVEAEGDVAGEGEVGVSGAAAIIINGTVSTLAQLEAFLAAQLAAGFKVSVTIIVTGEGKIIVIVGETPGDDFVTGGGWIIGPNAGAKGNFGLVAGPHRGKPGQFRGNVNYVDHGAPAGGVRHVKSTSITGYFGKCPSKIRHISGEAKVNGQAGFTFLAHAEDNGEPGINDRFGIRVFNALGVPIYSAFGKLGGGGPGGGNIQLHPSCP